MNTLFAPIKRHWRGEYHLLYAFLVYFIGISFCAYWLSVSLKRLLLPYVTAEQYFFIGAGLFGVYWLFIYPWQAIGVIRSSEKNPAKLQNSLWIIPIQATTILGCLFFFTGTISLIQKGFALYHEEDPRFVEIFMGEPSYKIRLDTQKQTLTIQGSLEHGLNQEIASYLEKHSIHTLILESSGGSIYEARGLAQQIVKHGLDTSSYQECSSSCTRAFIAGKQRTLGKQAKLGFHQYYLNANYQLPNTPEQIQREQQKDLTFFHSQQIREDFLARIFEAGAGDMWFPDRETLLEAGVVHE